MKIAHLALLIPLGLLSPASCRAQDPPPLPHFDRVTPAVLAVRNVGPAVVNIKTKSMVPTRHLFGGLYWLPQQRGGRLLDRSLGSGVIIHRSGFVLTNEHVVHGADAIIVTLRSGESRKAEIVATNF